MSMLVRVVRMYRRQVRIQKVLSEGSNFNNVFFLIDKGEDPYTTISGPSSVCMGLINIVALACR